MKAVFHGIGDIRFDNVKESSIKHEFDAIVRLTASAICGTDLYFVRGTVPGMQEGTILGHEGVGVVEEIGKSVRNVNSAIEACKLFDRRVPVGSKSNSFPLHK